ncbi:MAG TPA: hypothetical protein VE990_06010 [Acidimicrobiales bacterium]|nr:hypothetical protein [Acidimicrobiales bacterium]
MSGEWGWSGDADELPVPSLTKQAELQLEAMEPAEQAEVRHVLDVLRRPGDVHRYGGLVGDSPAGTVWRIRAGRIGVFVAVDEDSLLVVGFAVRRGGSLGWYREWM